MDDPDRARVVNYDYRERKTVIESCRVSTLSLIEELEQNLSKLTSAAIARPISIQHMPDAKSMDVFTVPSTVMREIVFVAHHCVHHQSMMRYTGALFLFPTFLYYAVRQTLFLTLTLTLTMYYLMYFFYLSTRWNNPNPNKLSFLSKG